jgi:hypothetical protein
MANARAPRPATATLLTALALSYGTQWAPWSQPPSTPPWHATPLGQQRTRTISAAAQQCSSAAAQQCALAARAADRAPPCQTVPAAHPPRAPSLPRPSTQILVELADLQDQEVGDGTTSVVILAAELLRRANDLVGWPAGWGRGLWGRGKAARRGATAGEPAAARRRNAPHRGGGPSSGRGQAGWRRR